MTAYFTHEFEAVISEFGVGKSRKVWYRVVFMPEEFEDQLPFGQYPRLRVDGEIADIPIANAFIPTGDGRRYLIVSPAVMKGAGLAIGDTVTVRFRIADQDSVEVPVALANALEKNPSAADIWSAITPGKKRALAHHVGNAKTKPTIEKRVNEALKALVERKGSLR